LALQLTAARFAWAAVLALAGCANSGPRYVVGAPYQASGVWHYPREEASYVETGLASVLPSSWRWRTANGEAADPGAVAAAHPTLPLPSIARLTNLETGRSLVVRINDRGTGDPRRLVQTTPRVAALLGFRADAARVELALLPAESREAAEGLAGAPRVAVAAAPRGAFAAESLAPPPGAAGGSGPPASHGAPGAAGADDAPAAVRTPERLPEAVAQGMPRPGRLVVRLGAFEEYEFAAMQRARVPPPAPGIAEVAVGRRRMFQVTMGPFAATPEAEAALARALAAGLADARIAVE
jgi:rare lipoprotein A